MWQKRKLYTWQYNIPGIHCTILCTMSWHSFEWFTRNSNCKKNTHLLYGKISSYSKKGKWLTGCWVHLNVVVFKTCTSIEAYPLEFSPVQYPPKEYILCPTLTAAWLTLLGPPSKWDIHNIFSNYSILNDLNINVFVTVVS